jgi:transposase
LEKREKRKDPKGKIKGKKQISYAETQARIMKHIGNYEYCYNGQISVDSKNQIIVGQHLTQNANDKAELDRALTEIEKKYKQVAR